MSKPRFSERENIYFRIHVGNFNREI